MMILAFSGMKVHDESYGAISAVEDETMTTPCVVDVRAGPAFELQALDRPETPKSAPPSWKRTRILSQSGDSSTSGSAVLEEKYMLALKRDLLRKEHDARMAALSAEWNMKSQLLQQKIRSAQAKEQYYRMKMELLQRSRESSLPNGYADG